MILGPVAIHLEPNAHDAYVGVYWKRLETAYLYIQWDFYVVILPMLPIHVTIMQRMRRQG
jgi:hypothetical protein